MTLSFWKMSGSGNDFIVIDHRKPLIPDADIKHFVTKVCRRGLSVGADGVILIEPSKTAAYAWRFFNADGSEADMCGNGSRCVAAFAYANGIAGAEHAFETRAGLISVRLLDGGGVRVGLPPPSDMRLNLSIEIAGTRYEGHFINTGVPHVVLFTGARVAPLAPLGGLENSPPTSVGARSGSPSAGPVGVVGLGRAIRHHPLFAPNGANVNFVQVCDARTLEIRTYERGVEDETLACGTGSVAATLLAMALGKVTPPVLLHTRGQIALTVGCKQTDGTFSDVFLEGDARLIYKGEMQEAAWQ